MNQQQVEFGLSGTLKHEMKQTLAKVVNKSYCF